MLAAVVICLCAFRNSAAGTRLEVPGTYTTIQEAIDSASNGDTVLVSEGIYVENIDFKGKRIVVGSRFLLTADTARISQTTINGGGSSANKSVVSFLGSEDSLSMLVGFTVSNGWASTTRGGGITIRNGASPLIEDCRILQNAGPSSEFRGLGVHCSGSSAVFRRCVIQNNTVSANGNFDHYGAGIYLEAGSSARFEDCEILDNQIAFSIYHRNYGGGVYCNGSTAWFENCRFSGNSADYGGGIEAVGSIIDVTNCWFNLNYGRSNGGGISSRLSSSVSVDSSIFVKNWSTGNGGAVYVAEAGQFGLDRSTITDNSAGLGAGIFAGTGTTPVAANSIIFYNWATEIYPQNQAVVSNCDVRGGYAGPGNLDVDPLFCDWITEDFTVAANSACVSGGAGGSQIGYFGSVCSAIVPQTRTVPQEYVSIQDAIIHSYEGDTVLVDTGSYVENIRFWGRRVLLTSHFLSSGDTSDIVLTIIDGGGADSNRSVVSFVGNEDSLSILKGFTITNGWSSVNQGGGITVRNGSRPAIEDCWIVDNGGPPEEFRGLGIHCDASSPLFQRCLIKGNTVSVNGNYDHFGGGVYLASSSSATFEACGIRDNQIGFSIYHRNYGGGVYSNNSTACFRSCDFSNNEADFGGGIEAVGSNIQATDCRFAANFARDSGGGISSRLSSLVAVDSSVFVKNWSSGNGGAFLTSDGGLLTVDRSTVTDNTALLGAGVYASAGTAPVLTNSIVFYNWYSEIYPSDLAVVNNCNVRGGYAGTENLDLDPLFCDWITEDYTVASNSACVDGGTGGSRIGYYASGCGPVFPRAREVPSDYTTIQSAILHAYQGDTVLVDTGRYVENIQYWGRRVTVGSRFLVSGDSAAVGQTVIDGGGSDSGRSVISFVANEDSLSALTGLTITNGWSSPVQGGGITIRNGSSPVIGDCRIVNNGGPSSEFRGIGVHCVTAYPVFRRCLIEGNTVTGNGNYDHFGAGVYAAAGSNVRFEDGVIRDNQIAFSPFHRNYGGGVYANAAIVWLENCEISANSADFGGAVQAVNLTELTLKNCTVADNFGRDNGGAVYGDGFISNTLNTIVSGNAAGVHGGGFYSRLASAVMINNTFSLNTAGANGGALYCDGPGPAIINSILWGNTAAASPEIDTANGLPSVSFSDVAGGWPGPGNIDADPLFEDSVLFYLSGGSPCIDAGDPDSSFYDPEDPSNPGFALFPAMGALRNDMGAYGGPGVIGIVVTDIADPDGPPEIPVRFNLYRNYPNPFNPTTTIRFDVARSGPVRVKVFNLLGQEVATLVSGFFEAGQHRTVWDGKNRFGRQAASGVYFYRIETPGYSRSRKMLLLK